MTPPTIEQRVQAQAIANEYNFVSHLLTADELRAVLVELEEQARLLGMSAERECDLRGKLERAERHAERVNDANDRLVLERDQWRECATMLRAAHAYTANPAHATDLRPSYAALARFDALVKEC